MVAKALVGLVFLTLAPALWAGDSRHATFDLKAFERQRVITAAEGMLTEKPVTLTAYPATRSAGGPHDYYSEGDYFWPDPDHPDGPFINRDGQSNPDNFNEHRFAQMRLSVVVPTLTAARVISGESRFAQAATLHLRAWYVDEATRMNPSLLYAQAIRNKVTGRSIGLIDTLHLVEVARSVEVLRDLHELPPDLGPQVEQWFADYLEWMTTHPYGKKEGNAKNNHATCYWLQVAAFAHLTHHERLLTECRRRFKEQLFSQIDARGAFPAELKRTKPYCYSIFNLDQMVMLCHLLSTPEENLWDWTAPDGRRMQSGPEFLYPFVHDKTQWPYPNDIAYHQYWPVRSCTWLLAGLAYNEPKYIEMWKVLEANPSNLEVLRNLPIRQISLWVE